MKNLIISIMLLSIILIGQLGSITLNALSVDASDNISVKAFIEQLPENEEVIKINVDTNSGVLEYNDLLQDEQAAFNYYYKDVSKFLEQNVTYEDKMTLEKNFENKDYKIYQLNNQIVLELKENKQKINLLTEKSIETINSNDQLRLSRGYWKYSHTKYKNYTGIYKITAISSLIVSFLGGTIAQYVGRGVSALSVGQTFSANTYVREKTYKRSDCRTKLKIVATSYRYSNYTSAIKTTTRYGGDAYRCVPW